MEYKINMGRWGSVFAVPCEVVDRFLNKMDGTQLKILIYILRNSESIINCRKVSEKLGITVDEAEKALIDLKDFGLLFGGQEEANNSAQNEQKIGETGSKIPTGIRYRRPSALDIAKRVETSKDVYYMMQEAQVILSRPISTSDSAVLIALHDNDGLPIDVILMLLQYAVSVGKTNMKYISKMGASWAECGVDDIEKAEKKIADLDRRNVVWKNFESVIGIDHRAPTSTEEEAVLRWVDGWHFDDKMIKEAYDRCVNMNGKYVLKYMDSIIKRWKTQGIFSIEQAKAENQNRSRSNAKIRSEREASYNIEEYENYNILDYIN